MAKTRVGFPSESRQLSLLTRRTEAARGSDNVSPPKAPLFTAGLFAGIGGIELGFERAGHTTELLCEIEPGACAVLSKRFPGVRLHRDVRTLPNLPRRVNAVMAGFPCQDLSQAGKTAGIEGSRSGLVGEVFRLIGRRQMRWVLLENVPFMLQLSKGRALEVIVAALENLGYRWAYRVVDSRAFGVPQRRERVYLLASRDEDPRSVLLADDVGTPDLPSYTGREAFGFYWTEGIRGLGAAVDAVPTLKGGSTIGIPSPPGILLPDGEVVTPDIRDVERMQGFEPDWTLPALDVVKRGARWKLVGNAVTVDAAEWIARRLRTPGEYDASLDAPMRRTGAWPRAAWNMGDGAHTSSVSAWPMRIARGGLEAFLRYPTSPLSPKATAGFLERAGRGSLRFPPGFLAAVEAHLRKVTARRSA